MNQIKGCTCQDCGQQYFVDVIIDDALWDKVKPQGKSRGAGLLCGSCIFKKLEESGKYRTYELSVK